MNRIYRIVWNAAKNSWQVASELGSKRAKSSTGRARRRRQLALMALAAAAAAGAHAADPLPAGGHVTAGQATLNYAGKTLTVNQGSNKAAIDWTGFSVGQGHTVNFVQPSANAVAQVSGALWLFGVDPLGLAQTLRLQAAAWYGLDTVVGVAGQDVGDGA